MIPDDVETLALADAIGALDADERRVLDARLAELSPQIRAEVSRLYELTFAMAAAAPSADPPPAVREQLMARIRSDAPATPPNYSIMADEGQWNDAPLPLIQAKVLAIDRERGLVTLLMRGKAGARYPAHHHTGPEQCYVLSGSVVIEGRVHRAGDYHFAEADSDHDELYTTEGAEVLLIGAIADYLPDLK